MAPFSVANNTSILRHSLINSSTLLLPTPLLELRSATPIGPSTRTASPAQVVPAASSRDGPYANSPRTYIGIGPAIVTNTPVLNYNNGSSSGVVSPPMRLRTGFIALVSLILLLFAIVGYLVWRRTRKRQRPALPSIRSRQKRSDMARTLAPGEDPPPSLASNLPRDIIRAMNAAPGSSTSTVKDKHEYPPTGSNGAQNKSSDPPYTYFSFQAKTSLPPLPTLEVTSPVSSAPSSPSPATPTFSPLPSLADDQAALDIDERFSWDFKCQGKHCSSDSSMMNKCNGHANENDNQADGHSDSLLSVNDQLPPGKGDRTKELDNDISRQQSEETCVCVRGEVFVLVPSSSKPDINVKEDSTRHSHNLTSDNCAPSDAPSPADVSQSSISSALLSALGLDTYASSVHVSQSAPAPPSSAFISNEPPRLERIVAMDSFSLDIDFEPFHIQVVQSRPASLSAKKVMQQAGKTEQPTTDDLERMLQSIVSSPRAVSHPEFINAVAVDGERNTNLKARPALSTPNHRSLSPSSSSLKSGACTKPSPVKTPKLDLVAETQIYSEETDFFDYTTAVTLPDIHVIESPVVSKTSYLRSSISLPGSVLSDAMRLLRRRATQPIHDENLTSTQFSSSTSDQVYRRS